MMNTKLLNEAKERISCRYMLVTTVAKRARQLVLSPERIGDKNPVSVAVEELCDNKIDITYPEEFLKDIPQ